MEKSTIEIKVVNQATGEVTEIKFSTDDVYKLQEIAEELIHTFYKKF